VQRTRTDSARRAVAMLVYNRVPKAGSTSMIELIRALAHVNNFRVDLQPKGTFRPDDARLAHDLSKLRASDVYINHANFCAATRSNTFDPLAHSECVFDQANLSSAACQEGYPFYWFNVVRDPVEKMASEYYYQVDPVARSSKLAHEGLRQREADPLCGCARLEFDACVRLKVANGCNISMPSQMAFFCEPWEEHTRGSCTLELAIRRLEHSYAVVGLTEESKLTVRLLEARLPRWFRNASAIAERKQIHGKTTKEINQLTNTTMTGCISKTAVALLAQHATRYSDEVAFYAAAKRLFWRRAVEAGLLSGLSS